MRHQPIEWRPRTFSGIRETRRGSFRPKLTGLPYSLSDIRRSSFLGFSTLTAAVTLLFGQAGKRRSNLIGP